MAKHDYRCRECDMWIEVERSILEEDDEAVLCDSCGEPMRKVYTPPGIVLRGRGWYKNPDSQEPHQPW
jgi:putative FmdB family regulatory protein